MLATRFRYHCRWSPKSRYYISQSWFVIWLTPGY